MRLASWSITSVSSCTASDRIGCDGYQVGPVREDVDDNRFAGQSADYSASDVCLHERVSHELAQGHPVVLRHVAELVAGDAQGHPSNRKAEG